ncbi:enoyl-CoA hydratase, putative [Pediculus humanus corporis]|uniref:Enoyl-CoA hydratase domain-containing protein 3, mitochondrial n=1 Tax=Pediculus humanus subsp. corporis TaxID=121224 RepID=E0VCA2_PEDHC|nr:enoyl-CoA hydratase, putative [Pediculus humanus corporis]EEB11024.1 enoyl-CoA hydratase, putative [Pediculus humanus corporis]
MWNPVFRKSFSLNNSVVYHILRRKYSDQKNIVLINDVNDVRKIVLNSPKTRNSLSMEMMDNIMQGIKSINNLPIRCIEISSSGPVFSSGHNLKDLASGNENLYLDTFSKCADLMLSIIEAPVPVLAKVNGIAAAAGCQLVATCDIVVASDKSTFSTPGANFGIFCSTPGIALSRCVNRKAAALMLLTGLPVTAEEGLRMGLVSKVCKENELDEEVDAIVNAIKSKSKAVIELGKKFFYTHLEKDIYSAYKLGAQVMTDNLKLVDGQEGLESFVQKRSPKWINNFTMSDKFK